VTLPGAVDKIIPANGSAAEKVQISVEDDLTVGSYLDMLFPSKNQGTIPRGGMGILRSLLASEHEDAPRREIARAKKRLTTLKQDRRLI
jgi:hypothetical protein